jgi:tetratricopeptide (TPR) repeat protein
VLKRLIVYSSVLIALFSNIRPIGCNDIWLHIKTGQWIWHNLQIPRVQLYSFLLKDKPWIDHSWLFQVLVYPFHHFLGVWGIFLFRFIILSLIITVLVMIARRSKRYFFISCLVVVLTMLSAMARFNVRPELFTLLFTGLFFYLLKNYSGKNAIYLLIPIQILWVNMHGYFLFGPVIVFLYILSRALQKRYNFPFKWNLNRLADVAFKKIKIVFILLILSLFINPYFYRGFLYPFSVIANFSHSAYQFSFISELAGMPAVDILLSSRVSAVTAMVIVFCYSLFINIRKIDLFDLFIFFILLAMAIKAERNIGLFIITIGILSLFNLNKQNTGSLPFFKFLRKEKMKIFFKRTLSFIMYFIVLGNIVFICSLVLHTSRIFYIYNLKGSATNMLDTVVSGTDRPKQAVRFINDNNIKTNLFNTFNNAAYLIYGLYPNCRIFIDARSELYGDYLLRKFAGIMKEPEILDNIKDTLSIEAVILPCFERSSIKMFKYLYASKSWKLVFFDGSSCVFLLDIPKYKDIIKENKIKIEDFSLRPDKTLIEKAIKEKYYPTFYINLARFFYHIGFFEKALEAIAIAERINPDDHLVYNLKGVFLDNIGRDEDALEAFLKSADINSRDASIFKNIGVYYVKKNRPDLAEKYFNIGLKLNPGSKELEECIRELRKCSQ